MRQLGHAQGRNLNILKLDCEGCEWNVFDQLGQSGPGVLEQVDMLLVEVHLSLRLGVTVDRFLNFFELILERHEFRFVYLRANAGRSADRHIEDELERLGARGGICCYSMALVKSGSAAALSTSGPGPTGATSLYNKLVGG